MNQQQLAKKFESYTDKIRQLEAMIDEMHADGLYDEAAVLMGAYNKLVDLRLQIAAKMKEQQS